MRKIGYLLLGVLLLSALLMGCSAADECLRIEPDALSAEAREAFAALDGERGVMLYADPAQMSGRWIRMYVVLYGNAGRTLSLSRSWMTLKMQVQGEPEEGYRVWRIGYDPTWIRRAEFVDAAGSPLTMDGYEELTFLAETELPG